MPYLMMLRWSGLRLDAKCAVRQMVARLALTLGSLAMVLAVRKHS
jgi:hypothetical protein